MRKKRGLKDIQDAGNVRITEDVSKARANFWECYARMIE